MSIPETFSFTISLLFKNFWKQILYIFHMTEYYEIESTVLKIVRVQRVKTLNCKTFLLIIEFALAILNYMNYNVHYQPYNNINNYNNCNALNVSC